MLRLLTIALCLGLLLAGCGDSDSDRVEGTGYSFELPEGWDDRTGSDEAEEINVIGFSPDTVVTGDQAEGFRTNVNVIRQGSIAAGIDAMEVARSGIRILRDPSVLGPEAERQLGNLKVSNVSNIERTRLDDEPAVRYTYTANRSGQLVRLRQVIAVRDGAAYTITFTTLRDRFDREIGNLEPILSSWNWD